MKIKYFLSLIVGVILMVGIFITHQVKAYGISKTMYAGFMTTDIQATATYYTHEKTRWI